MGSRWTRGVIFPGRGGGEKQSHAGVGRMGAHRAGRNFRRAGGGRVNRIARARASKSKRLDGVRPGWNAARFSRLRPGRFSRPGESFPFEHSPWIRFRRPFRSQASLFIASTISSKILSASFMGTWHVPTRLCPPPPYLNIREPTSMEADLLMMLYPQVITIFCFR